MLREITRKEQAENLFKNRGGCSDIRHSARVILEWIVWGGAERGWVWEDTGESVDLSLFEEFAEEYIYEAGRRRLFFDVYNEFERETCLVCSEYVHRFSERYIKRYLSRLRVLKGVRGVFLTLTTDPARHSNLKEAGENLKRNWNKFRTYLNKYKKRKLSYVAVMEFSPDNKLPHLHIVFPGEKYLLKKDKIVNLWKKYGQGKIVDVGVTRKDVYSYVLKYMFKTVVKNNEISLSPALVWAGGWRMLMSSRGLIPPRAVNKKPGLFYTFLGGFYGFDDVECGVIVDYEILLLRLLLCSKRLRRMYDMTYLQVCERLG